jgi:hypothetical protein
LLHYKNPIGPNVFKGGLGGRLTPFYNVKNIAIETGISVLHEATAKKCAPPRAIRSARAFRELCAEVGDGMKG